MKEGDVIVRGLVPAHQDAPEAVQPAVGALHHPAPGLEPSFPFDRLCLLAPAADMGGEAELLQRVAHLVKVVAFIQTHALGMLWTGFWPWYAQTVHRGPHQLHVMTVGPVHRQTHRNALSFGQQAALDATFASVSGVGAGFSPHPGAIWSWRRPYSANSSPVPSVEQPPFQSHPHSRNTPAATHCWKRRWAWRRANGESTPPPDGCARYPTPRPETYGWDAAIFVLTLQRWREATYKYRPA